MVYLKSIFRSIRLNFARFISIIVITVLGISFVAGLGSISPVIEDSFNEVLNGANASDLDLKCKLASGFGTQDVDKIKEYGFVKSVVAFTAIDTELDGLKTRIYIMPDLDYTINELTLESGEMPIEKYGALVERDSKKIGKSDIGDEIVLFKEYIPMGITYTVSGIVSNPLIFDRLGEPTLEDTDISLEQIIYIDSSSFPVPLPITDIYVDLDTENENYFSSAYLDEVEGFADIIEGDFDEDFLVALSIEDTKSYALLTNYTDKVRVITLIFPVFFIVVTALVVMTTIARMIEEERLQIGCLKSIGYGNSKIIGKYAFITLFTSVVSGFVGMLLGYLILPNVIYPTFNAMFFMPEMSKKLFMESGLVAFALTTVVCIAVACFVCKSTLKEKPSNLLIGKAPKSGKTILLEKIKFIWNRFSFKYKSSFRNIFRYKRHLIMTLVSVAGSTALVLAGFGLLDATKNQSNELLVGFEESIGIIALVVIAFALLLCVFVIYNLTNLNISERKKEIATLKVLGYKRREVLGYIYREIMIMAAVGAVFGIGLGILLIRFVFHYLDIGSLSDVKWYSYVVSYLSVILFVGATDLLLMNKILKIDMTSSLKSNE